MSNTVSTQIDSQLITWFRNENMHLLWYFQWENRKNTVKISTHFFLETKIYLHWNQYEMKILCRPNVRSSNRKKNYLIWAIQLNQINRRSTVVGLVTSSDTLIQVYQSLNDNIYQS